MGATSFAMAVVIDDTSINALRCHLPEFGIIAPQGVANLYRLAVLLDKANDGLPNLARDLGRLYLERIAHLTVLIEQLMTKIKEISSATGTARLLRTMPGIVPICAMAIETFAPTMDPFESSRDYSAWLGLTLRQHSSGGKQRLGRTSKMGQRDIRRLLIVGAMSVIASMQRYKRQAGSWLQDKLNRKPRIVAAITLANKMARRVWAILTKGEAYDIPAQA